MNDKDTAALGEAINVLMARQEVMTRAICLLIQQLPSTSMPTYAGYLREDVGEYLRDSAHLSTPETDSSLTLQLAVFLEAAGQPPQR